jgi:hypothetical protein
LRVKGYRLEFNDRDAFSLLLSLDETDRMQLEDFDRWLRQRAATANPCT